MPHLANHNKTNAKKLRKKPDDYPFLTKAVLFMAIAEPLMTIPQVYEVWVKHETAGVSLPTWGFMLLASLTWLTYSIKAKSIPVIVSSTIWGIMEGLIVFGLVIF